MQFSPQAPPNTDSPMLGHRGAQEEVERFGEIEVMVAKVHAPLLVHKHMSIICSSQHWSPMQGYSKTQEVRRGED